MQECKCAQGDFHYRHMGQVKAIGRTASYSYISVARCTLCGTHWLEFAHEEEGFTGSGLWYKVPIPVEDIESITAENARARFETAESYWGGGSYFGGKVQQMSGTLTIAPYIGIM